MIFLLSVVVFLIVKFLLFLLFVTQLFHRLIILIINYKTTKSFIFLILFFLNPFILIIIIPTFTL